MAEIGKATLTIVPKLPGLDAAVKSAFAKVDAESIGEQAGARYSSGLSMKTGIVAGTFAAVTHKALGAVTSQVDAAISRFDTLNNFPRVMDALGYSSDQVDASLAKIDGHLQGLPTALNSMVSTVQGISAITGDLGKATDAGLAINDMLLAGGGSTQVVNAALEQFRQILAKGKPELEDWKALTNAASGQMAQLARAMLGPTASAQDLYAALGGGKNDPIFTMDEFMDAIIRLDSEGSEGMKSFAEQAREATGGVQTSMANLNTAMARGIANLLDTVGQANISSMFGDAKGFVDDTFKGLNGTLEDSLPLLKGGYDLIKEYGPALIAGGAAFTVFNAGANKTQSTLSGLSKWLGKGSTIGGKFATAASRIGHAGGLISAGLSIGTFAIAAIGGEIEKAQQRQENFEKSTTGLRDAVANAAALDTYRGKVDGIGQSASIAAMSADELAESSAKMVDAMNERHAEAENNLGTLNAAQQIIENSVGVTEMSTDAQGRLKWAIEQLNEQLGLSITANDVINGTYVDQDGNVQNLTSSIDDLIAAKKREIETDVLLQDYEDVLKEKREAEKTVAKEYDSADWDRYNMAEAQKAIAESIGDWEGVVQWEKVAEEAAGGYFSALEQLKGKDEALESISNELGYAASAADESGDAISQWSDSMRDSAFFHLTEAHGGFDNLIEDMRSLGVNTDALKAMSQDDLMALASSYDGTTLSIANALGDVSGALGQAQRESMYNARLISESLNGIDAAAALQNVGLNINDLALAMANAGLQSTDLSNISSQDFANLAANCGGSIDAIIGAIAIYNDTPILDKDGNVTVEQTKLVDALGNIYTWNGEGLVDQNGVAVADTKQLMDANGQIVEWNDNELKPLDTSVEVEYSQVWDAYNALKNLAEMDGTTVSATVNANMKKTDNAAGGFRFNAAGGYRFHAAGAIATRAMPLDIVGEDGAEAIIPLTNKRYSEPFARTLAEQMGEAGGGSTVNNYHIYLNGSLVPGGFKETTTLGDLAHALEMKAG